MKKIVVLCVMSCALIVAAFLVVTTRASAQAPKRVEITAKRFAFDPNVITLKQGEPVILVLKSTDVAHGLRFRELGVDLKVGKGGTSQVQFTPNKVGDFIGHCSVFCGVGHGTMALTLHVVR